MLKKITNVKQIVFPDAHAYENLGSKATKPQMLAKIQRIWHQLDTFRNSECLLIENKIKENKERI